ncbi:hypothetical protein A3860_07350 [Niastella vici]|uniref:Uncharacterized protein n=2 Tax=Niastella vici TaxID=1703345 RepID=A0A1V9FIE5_9BACT|nr:hypothetical protein A3860_07350 [Niastella vici]
MLRKIKRQACLNKYSTFPLRDYDTENDEEVYSFPTVFRSYILTIPAKTFRGNIRDLGIEISRLAKELKANSLIFLGDSVTPHYVLSMMWISAIIKPAGFRKMKKLLSVNQEE